MNILVRIMSAHQHSKTHFFHIPLDLWEKIEKSNHCPIQINSNIFGDKHINSIKPNNRLVFYHHLGEKSYKVPLITRVLKIMGEAAVSIIELELI